MSKVTFEFDYFEDKETIRDHMKVHEYKEQLQAIFNHVRNKLKYGDTEGYSEDAIKFLEQIKEMSWFE